MSRLEQAAKLVMVGLMEGSRKRLTPYDQFVLSTWMIKTCLTYDASIVPRCIPEEIGSRVLFEQGYPLPASHVILGFDADHIPEGSFVHSRALLSATRQSPSDLSAVLIGFQFDQLILQAMINLTVIDNNTTSTGLGIPTNSPRYERIWPTRDRFLFPTDAALIARPAE